MQSVTNIFDQLRLSPPIPGPLHKRTVDAADLGTTAEDAEHSCRQMRDRPDSALPAGSKRRRSSPLMTRTGRRNCFENSTDISRWRADKRP